MSPLLLFNTQCFRSDLRLNPEPPCSDWRFCRFLQFLKADVYTVSISITIFSFHILPSLFSRRTTIWRSTVINLNSVFTLPSHKSVSSTHSQMLNIWVHWHVTLLVCTEFRCSSRSVGREFGICKWCMIVRPPAATDVRLPWWLSHPPSVPKYDRVFCSRNCTSSFPSLSL